jgi:hypothetical protein
MGFELSWIAMEASCIERVLAALKLRATDEIEDAADSELTLLKTGGWAIIIENHAPGLVLTLQVLKAISKTTPIIACSLDEHRMTSESASWTHGKAIWSVAHDCAIGAAHLQATGTLPSSYETLRSKAAEIEDADVDLAFDVPIDVAKDVTGYRHDRSGAGRYVVLSRIGAKKRPEFEPLLLKRLAELGFVRRVAWGSPTMLLSNEQRAFIDITGTWQGGEWTISPWIRVKNDQLGALRNSLVRDTPYDPDSEWGAQVYCNIGHLTPDKTDRQFTFAEDGTLDKTLNALTAMIQTYVIPFLDENRTLEQLFHTMETQKHASYATKKYDMPLALYLLNRPREAAAYLTASSNFEPVTLPGVTFTVAFGQDLLAEKDRRFVAALLALIEKPR